MAEKTALKNGHLKVSVIQSYSILRMVPRLGIEPRTQGFSVAVQEKTPTNPNT